MNRVLLNSANLPVPGGYDDMPKRYQDPKLEKRTDVARPYWFIRVRLRRGDPRSPQRIGFCDEMTLKQAKETRGEFLKNVNSGLFVGQARVSFRAVVERYQKGRLELLGTGTQARYRSQIVTHILPAFGDRALRDIDQSLIEAWIAGKAKDGLSWWTREGLRGVLSSIFAAAKDWGWWTGENPAVGVKLGVKQTIRNLSQRPPLTTGELQSILAAVSPDTRFMLLVATLIGLRVSEILGLKWSDIDMEAATLKVNRRYYRGDIAEPKTEASKRTRRLGPFVEEFKARFPGPHARDWWVFGGPHLPPIESDILRYELRPALKRLGLYFQGFGWHHFRRQNVSWRQTVGQATPMEAQKAAGHKDLKTTLEYFLVDPERESDQVGRMFDRLMGPTGETKQ